MKMKKGQAATEFLMTYGWALLVVLIAISTLAYFGVLSPGRFLPEKCTVDPGFACLDWSVTSTTTQLVLKNGAGEDLTNVTVTLTDGASCNDTFVPAGGAWNNGDEFTADFNCTLTSGASFSADISFDYTKPSGLSHRGTGELITKVQ
ncbi:hypothetical protein KY334_00740 [Candidatus Woesearchaeota archaeon]|nr:hypothetical protein [Candidatus Woesearchaeota archaeon]